MKTKALNEMKLSLPSLSANEGVARAVSGIFLSQLNPTVDELADVKCAVSEAVTNCIVHAYRHKKGDFYITVDLYADRTVTIRVLDKGCGICDVRRAREPLFTTDAAGERSGMGFTVMENFMDRLTVSSREGKGTLVVLTKRLGRQAMEA